MNNAPSHFVLGRGRCSNTRSNIPLELAAHYAHSVHFVAASMLFQHNSCLLILGNHVNGKTVSRVRIPPSPPKKKDRLMPVFFLLWNRRRKNPPGSTPSHSEVCRSATARRAALGTETSLLFRLKRHHTNGWCLFFCLQAAIGSFAQK